MRAEQLPNRDLNTKEALAAAEIRRKISAGQKLTPEEEAIFMADLDAKYEDRKETDGDNIKRSIH